jgi:hypothetical protein
MSHFFKLLWAMPDNGSDRPTIRLKLTAGFGLLCVFLAVPSDLIRAQPAINQVTVDPTVVEGGVATLTGQVSGPAGSSFILAINWGDLPAVQLIQVPVGSTSFSATHQYLNYHQLGAVMVPAFINLVMTANDGVSDATFISAIFQDVLGRPVDASSQSFYLAYLSRGAARSGVVTSLTGGAEYRQKVVADFYQRFLHRAADAAGLNSGVNFLAAGGTDEQYLATLIASAEYFQNRGNGSNSGFLDALYFDLLNRSIDANARALFLGQLGSGTTSGQVATAVLTSAEYNSDLVTGLIWRFLHRAPSSADIAFYQNLLNTGGTDEQVMANLGGSAEYYSNRSGSTASAKTSLEVLTAPPKITSLTITPGTIHVAGSGLPLQVYTIQTSSDLAKWGNSGTATADSQGLFSFDDKISTASPNGFYRVVYQ